MIYLGPVRTHILTTAPFSISGPCPWIYRFSVEVRRG